MIEAYVQGQRLRIYTPLIAADTVDYITAQVKLSGEWTDYGQKYMKFRNRADDPITYNLPLNNQGRIEKEQHLNLSAGLWDISVFAGTGAGRVTTNEFTITVEESGLRDAPLGELPISTAEMLDARTTRAVELAQSVVDRANAGEFQGRDGTGFRIKGYVASTSLLPSTGELGDMYGVGTNAPYSIYAWDSRNSVWVNNGTIQGPQGEEGSAGKHAVPSVEDGYLSWEWSDGSSGGLPERAYIKGEQGQQGSQGTAGKSAYQAAVEAGYEGSEENFNRHLAFVDQHGATHAAGGSDAVTGLDRRSMDASALTQYIDAEIPANWTHHSDGYYYQSVSVTGLGANDRPNVHFRPPAQFSSLEAKQEAFRLLYDAEVTGTNSLKLYAREQPGTAFSVTLEVARI